jgi:membrane protease YdiL (CAAX protease family)
LFLYTNTRFEGVLDAIPGTVSEEIAGERGFMEEVDLGEKWVQREYRWSPWVHYTCEKCKSFLKNPYRTLRAYDRRTTIPLSLLVVFSLIFSFLLVKTLKKTNEWELLWGFKRVFSFLILSFVSPVALGYLGYRIAESKDYRKALGFRKITGRQLIVTVIVGVVLFLVGWFSLFLLQIHGVDLPRSNIEEHLEKSSILVVLSGLVATPIVEEAMFSGYLYPLLRKKLGVRMGIILNALLFALIHLKMVLIPFYFVRDAIKMYAYEKTHCIFVPIIIHFLYNFLMIATVVV